MFENWGKNTGKGIAPAGERHIREINKFYGNIDEIYKQCFLLLRISI